MHRSRSSACGKRALPLVKTCCCTSVVSGKAAEPRSALRGRPRGVQGAAMAGTQMPGMADDSNIPAHLRNTIKATLQGKRNIRKVGKGGCTHHRTSKCWHGATHCRRQACAEGTCILPSLNSNTYLLSFIS